jgi:hypothetical protein
MEASESCSRENTVVGSVTEDGRQKPDRPIRKNIDNRNSSQSSNISLESFIVSWTSVIVPLSNAVLK